MNIPSKVLPRNGIQVRFQPQTLDTTSVAMLLLNALGALRFGTSILVSIGWILVMARTTRSWLVHIHDFTFHLYFLLKGMTRAMTRSIAVIIPHAIRPKANDFRTNSIKFIISSIWLW
jgi:hypothetical protein